MLQADAKVSAELLEPIICQVWESMSPDNTVERKIDHYKLHKIGDLAKHTK